jgi:hypothetical protein
MTIGKVAVSIVVFVTSSTAFGQANKRDTMVLNDRKTFAEDANWIYNDLAKGFAAAKESDKPMLVVFR